MTSFDRVKTPVVKMIHSKAKQHRSFKAMLAEVSAEYLLLHTDMWWLSRGRVLESRGEDASLLRVTEGITPCISSRHHFGN